MVSEDKIIKQGIRQTEAWFKEFKKQVNKDLSLCDTWQEFLERTEEYTTGNVMVSSGYSNKMQDIIVQMLNDIKFKRASQRELIEQTIRHNVGNLITDVGEDIKQTTRTVVSKGYDEGLHPTQIGRNISKELDTINHKRARTIARTEVKRTDTIANYIIAKEDGATGFTVTCRPDCCPLCAKEYADIDNHVQGTSQYGKAIGGEKEYHIDDVSILPPFHPNCRCTVYYFYDHTVPRQTENSPADDESSSTPAKSNDNEPETLPIPKTKPIDITHDDYYYSEFSHELTIFKKDIEEVEGKKYHNGLDITQYFNDEKGWADVPKSIIDTFNAQFNKETKHQVVSKSKEQILEPILKKDVTLYTEGLEYTVMMKNVDEINGKYYFKGLDITDYLEPEDGKWFDIPESVVDAHNKKVNGDPEDEPAKTVTKWEYIYDNELSYSQNQNAYMTTTIGNHLTFNEETGKYEYKGLVESFHKKIDNSEDYLVYFTKESVEKHNNKGTSDDTSTETVTTSNKKLINTLALEEADASHYFIDGSEVNVVLNTTTGKYELNGLVIEDYDPNLKIGLVEIAEVEDHNNEVIYAQDNLLSDVEGNGVVDNKYINAMSDDITPTKVGDEIFIKDNRTGKSYVYDEDAFYERKQDEEQLKVKFNRNETNSTEHWGRHGHQIINGLIYKVKRVDDTTRRIKQDYSYYAKDMDKLTPLYNKVQDLAIQRENGEITNAEFNKEKNKIYSKAEKIINNVEDNYRATHLDVDDVRNAMWEIFDMDISVEKSPDLLQDTFLVRFGHFNDEWCEVGKKITFDGYTSTTYESGAAGHFEEKMAENPNRWAILILAEKGSNGVRLNRQFNALTTEREWMLARRQGFEVVGFDKKNRCAVIRLIKH